MLGRDSGFNLPLLTLNMKTLHITTLASFCEASHLNPLLIRAVVRQFGGWESFVSSAPDVSAHGIDGGFTGFIYTRDTVSFALRNIVLIRTMASEQAAEQAISSVELIQGFGCFRHDSQSADTVGSALWGTLSLDDALENHSTILNALAWYAGEEVCRSYTDLLES
jgi:hypothetical protein